MIPLFTTHNRTSTITQNACRAISNITAGTRDQIQSVLDADIIPPLIHLLAPDVDLDVRKEAAWAICNITAGGTPDQIKFVVDQGCVPHLSELLLIEDQKVIFCALDAIEVRTLPPPAPSCSYLLLRLRLLLLPCFLTLTLPLVLTLCLPLPRTSSSSVPRRRSTDLK